MHLYVFAGVTEGSEPKPPRTSANRPASQTITPRTPAEFLVATKPKATSKPSFRLDANAPIFIPSCSLPSQCSAAEDYSDIGVISSNEDFDSGPESLDTDDLAFQYSRLRLQHDKVTSSRKTGHRADADVVHKLDMRLHALKKSYFFDEQEAEAMYQVERDKIRERALQDQLRGMASLATTFIDESIPSLKRPSELQPLISTASTVTSDIFADDSGDSTTRGIFELLDDMPTTETDARGKTITIRDMAMPKHWSGRTPKMLLSETVAKSDRYAAIGYSIISSGSRARRAGVSIRWEGKKMDEWLMEDVACYDDGQAEQYIATVALHALTFPRTDGFAASVSTFPGSQTFFRLLPAIFRDLWNELEETRKVRDDQVNRDVWAKLLSILEVKMEASEKVGFIMSCFLTLADAIQPNEKIVQSTLHTKNLFAPPTLTPNTEVLSEQLATSFRARQASASYQEMLVSQNDCLLFFSVDG
jgi:ATP-dependent RNA helicase DHX29